MGRKRKAATPVKRASPAAKQLREERPFHEEEETQEELTIVEEPERDPLATQEQECDPGTVDSDGGGGGDDGTGSEWEEKCRQWVVQQEEPDFTAPEPLPDDEHDEVVPLTTDALRRPLRNQLKDLTEMQIQNSVMFDCEWERCKFESNNDLEFTQHVEGHAQRYLAEAVESEGLVCFWDLCEFRTASATELESHVHFHAYHSRLKTYGASLDTCIEIPKCNNDSQRRNNIEIHKTAFRCEWGNCDERFNKVVPFFQHVNDHVKDQFPVDRKSTKETLLCQWTNCSQQYCRRSVALEHVRSHSTERTIGCYTCGVIYTSRLKYIEHCRRQVDWHLRKVPCPDCDKVFATPQLMKDHRSVHSKRYPCPQCPMRWPSQKALACHIRYRHIVDKPFKCHLCEHRSVSIHDLEAHLMSHQTKPVYKCPYKGCVKASNYEITVQRHIFKDHLGYPMMVYACHLCDKTGTTCGFLSKHLAKVHGLEREPGYNRFTYKQDTETDGKYRLASFLKNRAAAAAATKATEPQLAIPDDLQMKKVAAVKKTGAVKPLPMVSDICNLERYLLSPQLEANEFPQKENYDWAAGEVAEIVPVWRTKVALKTYENKAKVRALKKEGDDF